MEYADKSVSPSSSVSKTSKEPPVHVQPLFYQTWVVTQVMTSCEACTCSMTSSAILAGTAVPSTVTRQFPVHRLAICF